MKINVTILPSHGQSVQVKVYEPLEEDHSLESCDHDDGEDRTDLDR